MRGLLVDLGSVVILSDWEPAVRELQGRAQNQVWRGATTKVIRDGLMASRIIHRFDDGKLKAIDFYREILEFFKIDPTTLSYREFRDLWGRMILRLNKPLLVLLRELREEKHVSMAIASNTQELHWEWMVRRHYHEVLALFDTFVLSYSISASKPDPMFYLEASLRLGIEMPSLVLLDDRDENGEGFRKLHGRFIKYTEATHDDAERELREVFGLKKVLV